MRSTKKMTVGAMLLAASLTMVPTALATQPATQPAAEPEFEVKAPARSADAIISRYIEAIGGEKTIRGFKQRSTVGTMSIPAMGLTGQMTTHAAAPNKFIMVASIPDLGEMKTGYTDGVAWSFDPNQGPMLQPEASAKQIKRQADFYSDLRIREMYKSVTSMPQETFEGKTADVLLTVDQEGSESKQFFDAATGLRIGTSGEEETQLGPMNVVTVFSDYKAFDGIKLPTMMVQKLGPIEVVMTTESVTMSDTVDPAKFETPAAIKTLIEDTKEPANAG